MIRPSCPGDENRLKMLWHNVFGDSVSYINRFFAHLYEPGNAIVCTERDEIAAAVYVLDAGIVTNADGTPRRAAYSYALATLPAYRGRGIGQAVTQAAIQHSFARGFACNVISPATEMLFNYYLKRGYQHAFSITEQIHQRKISRGVGAVVTLMSVAEYAASRKPFTSRYSTQYPIRLLNYVAETAIANGGGLFRLEFDTAIGIAAADRNGDTLCIHELLLPEAEIEAGAQALLAHLNADTAIVRTPPTVAANTRPHALIALPPGEKMLATNGYFPFVLD